MNRLLSRIVRVKHPYPLHNQNLLKGQLVRQHLCLYGPTHSQSSQVTYIQSSAISSITIPPHLSNHESHRYARYRKEGGWDGDDDPAETIRNYLDDGDEETFGLTILRCTYKSQADWDAFVRAFQDQTDRYLWMPSDQSIRPKFCCPIVEDRSQLDGVDWRTARTYFDESVYEDYKQAAALSDTPGQDLQSQVTLFSFEKLSRQFFIYADQASVESVARNAHSMKASKRKGAYYFHLVKSALNSRFCPDGGEYAETTDEQELLYQHQKFKVYDFLTIYSDILNECWPYFHHGDDDISTP